MNLRAFFTLIFLAVLAAGGWLAWALWLPVTPEGQKFVLLRPGFSTRHIATELKTAGVIRSSDAFVVWHYLHAGHSLKAGEYLFEKTADARAVHDRLARGDVYYREVVIPEGFTMFDIGRAVEDAGLGSSQDFLKAARENTALIADLAPDAKSLEGYLFPATYQFSRIQSPHDMVAAMVKQFRLVAREIGLIEGPVDMGSASAELPGIKSADAGSPEAGSPDAGSPEAGSPDDRPPDMVQRTVILASIIEKETAAPEERPLVASVYYNRMEKRVPLQADPSVIYAELLQGTYQGALHHADMQADSSYNTYRHPGLPPGPIGNPGKSSLLAAMHPAQTDYLYFVSNGNGHHRFARSLEEHNKNVAAYRRVMQGK